MFNRTTLLIIVAALAAGLGLWFAQKTAGPAGAPELDLVTLLPQAREIPDFQLQRADGGVLSKADLKGRWSIVFLGFTHCPDICPTTLAELGQAERLWQASLDPADHPNIVFVSADPERDSPELTQEYAGFFTEHAIGATADIPTLERFSRSLLLVFAKAPTGNGDYTIDHSAQLALLDPDAHFVGFIRPQLPTEPGPAFPPRRLAEDLQRLVEAGR
ncbi:MAG: SCO family protein [Lysobacteraceae bacterium]